VIDNLEADIIERQKNPVDVWGIHYAWKFLSRVTGGKQKGELIILAGEPGVGKSWFAHQDALFTALGNPSENIPSTPVLVWSGEMARKQVFRRMFEMLGVPKRHMLTGNMSGEDWQFFTEAKALIVNSPLFVSDIPLDLQDVRQLLEREIGEHGVEQAVFDYDWLINAPGKDEIQTSQNTSRLLKQLARELNISIVLVSSVNKMGMDTTSGNITKSNVSGSGKKLHDADVIYILTKFNEKKNSDLSISVTDYDKVATLHISKGRELDYHVPNKAINYMRETPNPKFKELKKENELPAWMTRKDIS
jgi:replicative DNA helicase